MGVFHGDQGRGGGGGVVGGLIYIMAGRESAREVKTAMHTVDNLPLSFTSMT